ncbi:SDR family NAD(P)-dependent oxidoreductase [Streptomyces sp. WMMB 322]|uniref:SDR family NAD(P)-dependent oxidoreductase n=1 Tax=Streptomyces sp. WMMB 322 TaxID=1286821 RepID=UPI0006E2BECF|nr:SDR family oxidoreductase [Streptomyces sp. WMMB 322]SCK58958.1 NAD(P)-dependent dehydrogenase, short-chain alcohol dehydrogenase family [Streptomyces sp. WMMB 322]
MAYADVFRLDGRRVAVVGGASGIGRESARALAAQGAEVLVADVDLRGAEETARLAAGERPAPGSRTGPVSVHHLDVLDEDAVRSAVAGWGVLDGLVVTVGANVRKRIADYTLCEFDRVVALNLRAYLTLVQSVAPAMAERGRGSVVGLTSMRAFQVEAGQSVYAASKAGLVQLLRTAAAEWGRRGVRFNAVAPGVVRTPLTDQIAADPDWYDAYAQASALGRWAGPEEIAGAVTYLVSDASTYVTGSVLAVDGGWTAVDGRYEPSV